MVPLQTHSYFQSISLESAPPKSLNLRGSTIAIPSHLCRYDCVDDALQSQIIHFVFNEGLSYVDTSECYNYPYETIRSIIKNFEENDQL